MKTMQTSLCQKVFYASDLFHCPLYQLPRTEDNKIPQSGYLRTTKTYGFTVLEVHSYSAGKTTLPGPLPAPGLLITFGIHGFQLHTFRTCFVFSRCFLWVFLSLSGYLLTRTQVILNRSPTYYRMISINYICSNQISK